VIVTVDDDMFYQSNHIERLMTSYAKNKSVIHCHRGRLVPVFRNGTLRTGQVPDWRLFWAGSCKAPVSKLVMAQGVDGILYPPHSLDNHIFQSEVFHKLCPFHDDLWFWVMAILHGTPTLVIEQCERPMVLVGPRKRTLLDRNYRNYTYHVQTVRVFEQFDVSKYLVEDRLRFEKWYPRIP
jgi:hypothetical protein